MFTGIVECTGKVVTIEKEQDNIHFTISAPFGHEVNVAQSISHDGVCLTTVKTDKEKKQWVVTAVKETLERSNLKIWNIGYEVNLERCMKADGRFDGHIVQGHVDQVAICNDVKEANGSWYFYFEYEKKPGSPVFCGTVPKGSISVNGVSLTVVDSAEDSFSVAIIPYTYQVTNFHNIKKGTLVNLEFDIIGKYIVRILEQQGMIK